MERRVDSLMRSEVPLYYEHGFTSPKRPYKEEFKRQIIKLINDQEDQIKQSEEDMRKTKDTFMCLANSLIATMKVKIEAQRVHPTKIEKITRFPTHAPSITTETLKPTMVYRVSMISKIKPTNYRTPHQHLNSNLKMPILHSFEENKLEYEDEDAVEIKIMGTGKDNESLEHNLYKNDITLIICHIFSLTLNPPIKPKDLASEPVAQPSNKNQTPPIPFPQRLRKEKKESQQKKFLENLKQLHINLPFIEALTQMPKYAKILKGLLTNKARLEEACTITMNERCSTVLLNKLSLKEKDPGSFTIPYDIGQLHINKALEYLGASISLMPYTMYEKLRLGEPKATKMSLELADRSIQYPRGIVKNVLIKVDKFVLRIDFVMLDMTKDSRVPIILGRPFLATARAMIDVFNKKITLRVGNDEVTFDVDQLIKRPPIDDDECYGIDDLDDTINTKGQELLENDEPDSFKSRGLEKLTNQSDLEECKVVCIQLSKKHQN
nr:hypothetical protein [Tanacetum cinerariifolium]